MQAQSLKVGAAGNFGVARTVTPHASIKPAFNFGIPVRKEFTRKWAIESGIYYNRFSQSDYFLSGCGINQFIRDNKPNLEMNYRLQNLQFPFLVDYNFGKGRRKTSFSLNSGLGISTYLGAKRTTTENCQGNTHTQTKTGLNLITPVKASFLLGFHVNYKLTETSGLRFTYLYKSYFTGVTKSSFSDRLITETIGLGYLHMLGKSKAE
mgnify:CR=1 FL=1